MVMVDRLFDPAGDAAIGVPCFSTKEIFMPPFDLTDHADAAASFASLDTQMTSPALNVPVPDLAAPDLNDLPGIPGQADGPGGLHIPGFGNDPDQGIGGFGADIGLDGVHIPGFGNDPGQGGVNIPGFGSLDNFNHTGITGLGVPSDLNSDPDLQGLGPLGNGPGSSSVGPGMGDLQNGLDSPGDGNGVPGHGGPGPSFGDILGEGTKAVYSASHGDVGGTLEHGGTAINMLGQDITQAGHDTNSSVLTSIGEGTEQVGDFVHEAGVVVEKVVDAVVSVAKDVGDAAGKAVDTVVHFFTGDDDKPDNQAPPPDHPDPDHPGQGSQPVDDSGTGPIHPGTHGAELPVGDGDGGGGNPLAAADDTESGGLGKDAGHVGGHIASFWDAAAQAVTASGQAPAASDTSAPIATASAADTAHVAVFSGDHSSSMAMLDTVGADGAGSHAAFAASDAGAAHVDGGHADAGFAHHADFGQHIGLDLGHSALFHI